MNTEQHINSNSPQRRKKRRRRRRRKVWETVGLVLQLKKDNTIPGDSQTIAVCPGFNETSVTNTICQNYVHVPILPKSN